MIRGHYAVKGRFFKLVSMFLKVLILLVSDFLGSRNGRHHAIIYKPTSQPAKNLAVRADAVGERLWRQGLQYKNTRWQRRRRQGDGYQRLKEWREKRMRRGDSGMQARVFWRGVSVAGTTSVRYGTVTKHCCNATDLTEGLKPPSSNRTMPPCVTCTLTHFMV